MVEMPGPYPSMSPDVRSTLGTSSSFCPQLSNIQKQFSNRRDTPFTSRWWRPRVSRPHALRQEPWAGPPSDGEGTGGAVLSATHCSSGSSPAIRRPKALGTGAPRPRALKRPGQLDSRRPRLVYMAMPRLRGRLLRVSVHSTLDAESTCLCLNSRGHHSR